MLRLGGVILIAVLLSACEIVEPRPNPAEGAAIERGRQAAMRLGCGACHTMPEIDWPQGKVGPSLAGFGDRALIAGRVPNKPEELAKFVRDAPSLVPGTAMPAVAMSDTEARDLAAWLQSLHAD